MSAHCPPVPGNAAGATLDSPGPRHERLEGNALTFPHPLNLRQCRRIALQCT